ncbi:hypothetical protein A8C32_11850 [Flavivirga aquatica]|uniref:Secretion system C-terminal sorting domain-containing protein n=1 Tax=Flavivirga aquatica TaxID=1849968 RepID=A0A1E5TDF7_9FLAO|nr:T9SS type A sorting domain-containing protein [Flavivirga aquatica]OEK09405.1 hypothetical protein A8C32_11850 [Flavivirga aquatica]
MKKVSRICYTVFLFLIFNINYAQTTLSIGDIVIIGYNSVNTDPDEFTFVLLTNVTAGTTINFTDIGWVSGSPGNFRGGSAEGVITWVADFDLPCGSEIIIEADIPIGSVTYSANIGTVTEPNGGFGLNPNNDQIIVYQGTFASPTMLYAVHYGSAGWTNATNTATSAVPAGLTDGTTAIYHGNNRNGEYDCSVNSGIALINAAVANTSNWNYASAYINNLGGCDYCCSGTSCCNTSVWNGTVWTPSIPTSSTNVIVDGDYSTAANGNFSSCTLTVNSSYTLTVSNGTYVEVDNDVTIDGQLQVETQGNFVQENDTALFTDNSSGGVQLTKTKIMSKALTYTYWSSPVVGETIETTFAGVPTGRRFLFNATNFVDNDEEIGNTGTFNTGVSDDIDDDGDDWQLASGAMQAGVGYAATAKSVGSYPDTQSFTFTGAFNTGVVSVPLVDASGGAYNDWNFIGNPYPGAIDVATFFTVNTGIVGTLYLWDQNTNENANASGNQSLNFSSDDYAMINGGGGVAASSGSTIPNGFVASGQGFFVEALSTGPVIFNNSMRVGTNNNSQFFKNTKSKKVSNNIDNKLWVNLSSDNGVFNQILLAYVNGATHQNDGAFYDAKRILTSGKAAILYSNIDNDNGKFAIQGRAVNNLNINEIINLGFKTNIEVATLYKLSIAQLQGGFLNDNVIYLKDNLLSLVHNLSDSDYTFTSETGEFNDRFQIVFNQNALSIYDALDINRNILKIIELENDSIQFKVSEDLTIKSIIIYDLLGKQLYNFKANKDAETYKLSNLGSGTYIAKVILSNEAIISKKMYKL